VAAADATAAALEGPADFPQAARLTLLAGLGPEAVTAREGALKLREAARLPAEGFDAEYLLHGNAVPLTADDALIVLGSDPDGFLARLAKAGREEGLEVTVLEQAGDELLAQIPLTAHLQLLALRRAEAGGHDPDTVITGPWADEKLWATGAP
jgi:glutamine---fructose-6-phosphate transaminase (isomerizing)